MVSGNRCPLASVSTLWWQLAAIGIVLYHSLCRLSHVLPVLPHLLPQYRDLHSPDLIFGFLLHTVLRKLCFRHQPHTSNLGEKEKEDESRTRGEIAQSAQTDSKLKPNTYAHPLARAKFTSEGSRMQAHFCMNNIFASFKL